MASPSIDKEFKEYWSLLPIAQKKSLLKIIKSLVIPELGVSIEQYNKEIDEAVARVEAGEFYTMEEIEKMAKDW